MLQQCGPCIQQQILQNLKLYSARQPAGLPVTTSAPPSAPLVDSRLTLMYKITYDLVAIPAADYLIPNTMQSRHNHQLAYRQIPTLKDYYKYTFFPRTMVHWNALTFYIPVLPTVAQFNHAVCQVVHVSHSLVYFFLTIHLFYSAKPPSPGPPPPPFALVYRTPSDVLYGG